jgi:phosphonate transport system permease protein
MNGIRHYSNVWAHRTSRKRLMMWLGWLALVALFVWCWQVMTKNTIWAFVADAPRQAADIGGRMVPPRLTYLPELMVPLWDTINIATLGTMGGVIMAVPVAFMAARNTTPSMHILRPAALFIIGPGILAGIVAIALRSIGFVGKLLYEAIEETDARQIEAVAATGASSAQIVSYGIVPQIMPAFWGITVFRWDINIRESTILGLVGAGGIGLKLQASLNVLAWPQVTMILILILGTVVLSEWISARVRHAII